MRGPLVLSMLAAIAFCTADAGAQAMATSGDCPAGLSADACYREGLTLAQKALGPRVVDEAGVREALRVLLGACEREVGDACYVAGRITAADTAAVMTRSGLASAAGRAAVLFAHGCYATERASAAACNALGFASAYAPEAAKPDSALDHLERGCESGSPTACVRAALLMDDWPADAGANSTRPAQLVDRACAGGSPGGCVQLARRTSARLASAPASRRVTPAFRAERETVHAQLRDACRRGLPTACTELGATFLAGDPVFRANADSAAFYLEMACSGEGGLWRGQPPRLGDGAACARLGRTLLAVVRVVMDRDSNVARRERVERGMRLLQRGCDLVDSESCADLAYHGLRNGVLPPSLAQLRAVTACNENSGYGCWVAGWLHRQPGVRDEERAASYLRRACELGYGRGCTEWRGTVEVKEDPVIRCRVTASGCTREMTMRTSVVYVPERGPEAFKYFRRACALGDPVGCARFAATLREAGDAPRADVFFRRACEYGDAESCWTVMLNARSSSNEVDEGEFRARACRLSADFCKRKGGEPVSTRGA
ncbi:MAG TPA: hypothetical protein VHG93_07285 [Longimicrobium sp.]|nr:hypothetical protein [Longimicrobium sp.]